MRTKSFFSIFLVLVAVSVSFYCYKVQSPTLAVEIYFDLSVRRESSDRPGFGWILEQNISISLLKWPETVYEKTEVLPRYSFNETRMTPVQFVVCMYLNHTKKELLTPCLNITGSYTAVVNSFFPHVNQGTYNLTITIHPLGFEKDQDRMEKLITIP